MLTIEQLKTWHDEDHRDGMTDELKSSCTRCWLISQVGQLREALKDLLNAQGPLVCGNHVQGSHTLGCAECECAVCNERQAAVLKAEALRGE